MKSEENGRNGIVKEGFFQHGSQSSCVVKTIESSTFLIYDASSDDHGMYRREVNKKTVSELLQAARLGSTKLMRATTTRLPIGLQPVEEREMFLAIGADALARNASCIS